MPLFEYAGYDARGRKVAGTIEGPGRNAVILTLRQQGVFPADLHEAGGAARRGSWRQLAGRRVPVAELAAVTRQLATLLNAGLPLDEALGTVAGQTDQPALGRALAATRAEVLKGEPLHAALATHERIFPEIFVSIVRVGEDSGTLDQALHRLADYLENQARLRSRLQAAFAYPALMTLVGLGVLGFLFAFVVPKITRMLEDLGQSLPWPTVVLIQADRIVTGYWWLLALLAGAGGYGLMRYRQTAAGRLQLDRLALRAPLCGQLLLMTATARFARTLGILLGNGVPLLKALDIARSLLRNRILNQAVASAAQRVQEGGSLAAALRESAAFPVMLAQMTAAGEKSGQLEEMLGRVADSYEHQTDLAISGLLSLLEPLLILLMGGIVGFVVLAILLPIFQASQGFG